MGEIKSALEIAMGKVEKLEKATDEERLEWKYVPEGEKLAASYLKEDCNLAVELGRYDEEARRYVVKGAGDILVRNIKLLKDDIAKRNNRRAMEGLKSLKTDKVAVENVYSKLRQLFSHYVEQGEQHRKQAYETLKTEFEVKVQQAMQQQLGVNTGIKIDVEKQPQFQEEWRQMQTRLDSQYHKLMEDYLHELSAIP